MMQKSQSTYRASSSSSLRSIRSSTDSREYGSSSNSARSSSSCTAMSPITAEFPALTTTSTSTSTSTTTTITHAQSITTSTIPLNKTTTPSSDLDAWYTTQLTLADQELQSLRKGLVFYYQRRTSQIGTTEAEKRIRYGRLTERHANAVSRCEWGIDDGFDGNTDTGGEDGFGNSSEFIQHSLKLVDEVMEFFRKEEEEENEKRRKREEWERKERERQSERRKRGGRHFLREEGKVDVDGVSDLLSQYLEVQSDASLIRMFPTPPPRECTPPITTTPVRHLSPSPSSPTPQSRPRRGSGSSLHDHGHPVKSINNMHSRQTSRSKIQVQAQVLSSIMEYTIPSPTADIIDEYATFKGSSNGDECDAQEEAKVEEKGGPELANAAFNSSSSTINDCDEIATPPTPALTAKTQSKIPLPSLKIQPGKYQPHHALHLPVSPKHVANTDTSIPVSSAPKSQNNATVTTKEVPAVPPRPSRKKVLRMPKAGVFPPISEPHLQAPPSQNGMKQSPVAIQVASTDAGNDHDQQPQPGQKKGLPRVAKHSKSFNALREAFDKGGILFSSVRKR